MNLLQGREPVEMWLLNPKIIIIFCQSILCHLGWIKSISLLINKTKPPNVDCVDLYVT